MHQPSTTTKKPVHEFLSGGGEMGDRIRNLDWSMNPLGPVASWPQSLRSALSICLNSNFPIAIYWGKDLILIYNDAWSPIPGNKHPWALGRSAKEVWPEIWSNIESQFQKAFTGEPGGSRNAWLPMNRHGYTEECYFDFTFTPIYGEGGKVEGVFNAVIETTKAIINDRQLQTLRDLGNLDAVSKNVDDILIATATTLEKNDKDFPFAVVYKIDADSGKASSVAHAGLTEPQTFFPAVIDVANPSEDTGSFCKVYSTNELLLSENNHQIKNLPTGGWEKKATHFIYLPVTIQGAKHPVAIILAALNPFRQFDEAYRQFAQLIADQVSTEVTNVVVIEEERKRAEALAEIDKAKTTFFTNISHEFRTPLTLMLGSLEELLNKPATKEEKEAVERTHRNAVRLMRLVNNLLDFSRLEAGRIKATFQPTDLARYTADLAGNFRSIIESAGLHFHVQVDDLVQPVYIDKSMWEKIVLNLLSNAFKYTLSGSINLSLQTHNDCVLLKVKDTGVGIPEKELPKMFQRFHRVENQTGRSFEGSGIGLSLVNELVKMHGGEITVSSKEGEGSEFTVAIPTGKEHLPAGQVMEKDQDFIFANTDLFTGETAHFAKNEWPENENDAGEAPKNAATVLVADDNSDMRQYIKNLLQKNYRVITATNGAEALLQIEKHAPQLLISDIMMPVMDGLALLKAVKENAQTQNLPVILLSARAGEEAKIEGLNVGADDYLVKPFSAKELLARTGSQIALAKRRDDTLRDIYTLFDEVPFAVAALKGDNLVIDYINKYNLGVWQCTREEVLGKPLFEARPDIRSSAEAIHANVYQTGRRFDAAEIPVQITNHGKEETRFFDVIIDPMRNEEGNIVGQIATSIDVTEKVLARKKIEEAEIRFRSLAENSPDVITRHGKDFRYIYASPLIEKFTGIKADDYIGKSYRDVGLSEEVCAFFDKQLTEIFATKKPRDITYEKLDEPGTHVYSRMVPEFDKDGEMTSVLILTTDITARKKAEQQLKAAKDQLELTLQNVPSAIYHFDAKGNLLYVNEHGAKMMGYETVEEALAEKQADQRRKKMREKFLLLNEKGEPLSTEHTSLALTLKNGKPSETLEQLVEKKTGNTFWILSSSAPLYNESGELSIVLTTATDITAQKTTEQVIRQSEEKFRTLAESLPQLVWMTDEKGVQEYASSSWKEYSGLEPTGPETWAQMVHPEDMEFISKAWGESMKNGTSYKAEVRLKSKEGEYRWHFVQGEPVRNDEGKISKWIGAFTDIHEQKTIEEKLEELVAERTKELQRSNEDLQQFAHVASHDLKEPVRKVRTFVSRLQHEYNSELPDQVKTYLNKIENAAGRMYSMIDGVLHYSLLNAAEQTFEPVNLNETLQSIEADLELLMNQKHATINYKNLPTVQGTPILLYQLFYNLVNNSLKFAKAGEPLQIALQWKRLTEKDKAAANLMRAGSYVQITLQDNGIGFDSNEKERIFQTFSRLNPKDKYEGTGLGLALSRKIVERHGGSISANGKRDVGATFYIRLPETQV